MQIRPQVEYRSAVWYDVAEDNKIFVWGDGMTSEEKNQAVESIAAINEFLANSNCSDFTIKYYSGEKLCLIGSFDLCYYSEIEILFEQVSYISMHTYFCLWDLSDELFKINFCADDADSKLEIQIGKDFEDATHIIRCDTFKVHIGTQGLNESAFS